MIDSGRTSMRLLAVPALLAGVLLPSLCQATLVGPGDIAFIRFFSDGIDNFAIVLLADADVGQLVSFNNSSYDGVQGRFGTDGNHFVWEVTDPLAAGTVVTFNRLSVINPNSSEGIIQREEGDDSLVMQLNQTGDTLYAYLGSHFREPEEFLAAISTESATIFAPTGLINGDTAIYLPPPAGTSKVREGNYVGPRNTETDFADYRSLIGNVNANWERRNTSGTLSPFDSSNFTLQNGATVPESPAVVTLGVLMLLACLSLGARRRRQPAVALVE